MDAQTRESQNNLTPDDAKQLLIEGNKRFLSGSLKNYQLLEDAKITAKHGQYPHTVILGCIDSRATSEQIFDQGIGNIFNTRVAGNVINDDVLASLEFSCKLAGSKLVVVMGHTRCGAITAACNDQKLGHVTGLLNKIKPSVEKIKPLVEDITSIDAINRVCKENVFNSLAVIREKSSILREMEENGDIKIVGAIYHIGKGEVVFLD